MRPLNFQLFKTELPLFLACLVALLGFLFVTIFRVNFHSVDVGVNLWIPTIQSITLTFFAKGIALIFDTISLVIISLVISSVLFLKNFKVQGLLLLGSMGGDALIVSVFKTLIHIERPTNGVYFNAGFSYPSGHSASCIVFGGVLAYFAWRHWQSMRSKSLISVGLGFIIGVVGFDRVYLNVHWFSDVIGGWLVGAFWLLFIILIFRHLNTKRKIQYYKFNLITNIVFGLAVVTSVLIIVLDIFGFSMFF